MKNQFLTTLKCEPMADGVNWQLNHALKYVDPWGVEIIVPTGFKTDFASIPNLSLIAGIVLFVAWLLAQWWWPFYGLALFAWFIVLIAEQFLHEGTWDAAAAVHDYMYRTRCRSFTRANWILFKCMKAGGAPITPMWKRCIIFFGVAVGGWWAWQDDRKFLFYPHCHFKK